MINAFDMHTHSRFSVDCDSPEFDIYSGAQNKGLLGVAVTDHCECNNFYSNKYYKLIKDAFNTLNPQKEGLNTKSFKLIMGVELGQYNQGKENGDKVLAAFPFDFVLASLHNIKNYPDFYFIDYDNADPDFLLTEYFSELLKIAKYNFFDCLSHITYPIRYIPSTARGGINLEKYYPVIDEILKMIIKNKKALELNTSGMRTDFKDFIPSAEILKRYVSFGGDMICLGSDAHFCYQVGSYFKEALTLLKSLGIKNTVYFEERKPHFVAID